MGTTAKGVPSPDLGDPPDVPADTRALAQWLDDNPGVRSRTYAQINALAGADLWLGRVVHQSNTGAHRPASGIYVYNGVDWRPPWNIAWGVPDGGEVLSDSNTGAITAIADVLVVSGAVLEASWAAVGNRKYKITVGVRIAKDATGGDVVIYVTTPGNAVQAQWRFTLAANETDYREFSYTDTPVAGGLTRKVRAEAIAGSLSITENAVGHNFIRVEDIGPNGDPA